MKLSLGWMLTTVAVAEAYISSTPPSWKQYEPSVPRAAREQRSTPSLQARGLKNASNEVISPKVFIISMFAPEANVWYAGMPELLARNITVPGFSSLYPDTHCTESGDVCELVTDRGGIHASSTITALLFSPFFDLRSTYFLIAGISGINPSYGTTGTVTFAKYAVQFDLIYFFDSRQTPANFSSGIVPVGAKVPVAYTPEAYPRSIYGTEVYELNDNLKTRFFKIAEKQTLNDSATAIAYRARYPSAPATQPPTVVACDTGTSNLYWSGSLMGDAFSAYTQLLTNGSGQYCSTQQEDNGTLEALLRGHLLGKVDFSRVAIMRTASDFDRAPPGMESTQHLLYEEGGGGFAPSIQNIYIAGSAIVEDVLTKWNGTYAAGVKADNYIGDLLNRLRMENPDIGTPGIWLE